MSKNIRNTSCSVCFHGLIIRVIILMETARTFKPLVTFYQTTECTGLQPRRQPSKDSVFKAYETEYVGLVAKE